MKEHEMTCRAFQAQVADWQSGRLSPGQSQRMSGHQIQCTACARVVQEEARLRELWREAAAPPVHDLWPQLSQRLEASGREAWTPWVARSRRWAFSGAAALAAVVILIGGGRLQETLDVQPHSDPPSMMRAVNPSDTGPAVNTGTLTSLADVAEATPSVDDPVGSDMENVWAHINTNQR